MPKFKQYDTVNFTAIKGIEIKYERTLQGRVDAVNTYCPAKEQSYDIDFKGLIIKNVPESKLILARYINFYTTNGIPPGALFFGTTI